jgi:DNA repair ATPase RecN
LRRVHPFLAEDGAIVASIPNVAHGSVRLALLAGEFRYRAQGLLDESHLRFFTRESIRDLFEETGYVVTHWERRRVDLDQAEVHPPAPVPEPVRDLVTADDETTTYQFVVRAVPSDAAPQLRTLREELRATREDRIAELRAAEQELERLHPLEQTVSDHAQALESTRAELARANEELDRLRAQLEAQEANEAELARLREELELVRRAHEVRGRRLVAERVSFADVLAETQAAVYGSRSWRYTAPMRAFFKLLRRGE